jgi:phosphoglycerate dehydrogenase-like enzyme
LRIGNQLGAEAGAAIRAAFPDVEVVDLDPRAPVAPVPPVEVLYALPRYVLSAPEVAGADTSWAAGVRWVHVPSTGVEKVPPSLLADRTVTCGRGVMSAPIAEYVLAVILARLRGIPEVFVRGPARPGGAGTHLSTLEGSTLGLVGFGAIGRDIAVRALPFGARVLATRRSGRPAEIDGVTIVGLEELVGSADALVVAAPATPATAGLIDGRVLKSAKPGVHIVNVARGSLIDQEALLAALDDGVVGHATLDVTTPEPLPDGHPLYSHPNVSVSPHVSAAFPDIGPRGLERFLDNLRRYRAGEPLVGLVDPDAGY